MGLHAGSARPQLLSRLSGMQRWQECEQARWWRPVGKLLRKIFLFWIGKKISYLGLIFIEPATVSLKTSTILGLKKACVSKVFLKSCLLEAAFVLPANLNSLTSYIYEATCRVVFIFATKSSINYFFFWNLKKGSQGSSQDKHQIHQNGLVLRWSDSRFLLMVLQPHLTCSLQEIHELSTRKSVTVTKLGWKLQSPNRPSLCFSLMNYL